MNFYDIIDCRTKKIEIFENYTTKNIRIKDVSKIEDETLKDLKRLILRLRIYVQDVR